jgi:hypothetical protein
MSSGEAPQWLGLRQAGAATSLLPLTTGVVAGQFSVGLCSFGL